MPAPDRKQLVRDSYAAFQSGDRGRIEELFSDDLSFYSPPDPGLDLAGYFERCWPNSGAIASFEFIRMIESGDEVVVTYESTKTDGKRLRNTEIHTFDGDRIRKVEVYFGWNL